MPFYERLIMSGGQIMTFLLLLAVLPGIMLVKHVYELDKIEQEPMPIIRSLLIAGALTCIPAGLAEWALAVPLGMIAEPGSMLGDLLSNFLGIALVEELAKYFVLKKKTWNHPDFNYRFDGIVYAVAASMGFAILENIMYVMMDGGMMVAVMRALLSIPGHGVFGIFMGYYYGAAKQCQNAGDPARSAALRQRAVWHPMLLHGFYDFALTRQEGIWLFVFFVLVAILYYTTFRNLKAYAANDEPV